MGPFQGKDGAVAGSRFHLRYILGEGGVGTVWEADQACLLRRIAVKTIRRPPGWVRGSILPPKMVWAERRFRQEALITAALEHPNIVPVHDLAYDDEGLPMLAMKRVDGRNWRDLLSVDFLTESYADYLGRHLSILKQVAQAVAFAHSQGIVHLDIKPSQVMIGRFGEVQLMDWGLAMPWSRLGVLPEWWPPTMPVLTPGRAAGSPGYMAPEQTGLDGMEVGPWTDMWLLGATLYEILTGCLPHLGASPEESFTLARETDPLPPRVREPNLPIPPELEKLAMECLLRLPEQRLASAGQFVERIDGWIRGDHRRHEAKDLLEKSRLCLSSAGTNYSLLSEALNQLDRALTLDPESGDIQAERRRALMELARAALFHGDLKLARVQAERLEASAEQGELLAEIGRREELQRQADARLAEALRQSQEHQTRAEGLVGFLLNRMQQALQAEGRLEAMRECAMAAMAYFDGMLQAGQSGGAAASPGPEAALHRWQACMAVGDVLGKEGRKQEAIAAFERAAAIARSAISDNGTEGENAGHRLRLAESFDRIGWTHYYQGHHNQAIDYHTQALELRRRLGRLDGTDTGFEGARGEARSLHALAIIDWRRQDFSSSRERHLNALQLQRTLIASHPDHIDLAAELTGTLATLSNVHRDVGDLATACSTARECLAIREDLTRRQPANPKRREDESWIRCNLGWLLIMNGERDEARAHLMADLDLRRRLAHEDPTNLVTKAATTFPLSLLGQIAFSEGDMAAALTYLLEAQEISRVVLQNDPETASGLVSLVAQGAWLCEIHALSGDWAYVAGALEEMDGHVSRLSESRLQSASLLLPLARKEVVRARLHRKTGEHSLERQSLGSAETFLGMVKAHGEDLSIRDLRTQIRFLRGESADPGDVEVLKARLRWTPTLEHLSRPATAAA